MLRATVLGLVAFTLYSPSAFADEPTPRYYLLLFGGKAERLRPQTAHTFATFVKAVPDKEGCVLEQFTISWLPERMPVRPFRLTAEPGRNYGLHETLNLFSTGRQELGLWGPYEIRDEWYGQALAHKQTLDGGAVRFQTMDRAGWMARSRQPRRPDISHCVHAITRTDEELRQASNPVLWYGQLVTRKVKDRMEDVGLLVDPGKTHDWLLPTLGLERYAFARH
jgi:hypothetical protein